MQWEEAARALLNGDLSVTGDDPHRPAGATHSNPLTTRDDVTSRDSGASTPPPPPLSPRSRRYNRVVWVSTCPHPCILINGIPFYAPERKSTLHRHCINNPTVIDTAAEALKRSPNGAYGGGAALGMDSAHPLCLSTLTSYAAPTSVPPARSVRDLVVSGFGGGADGPPTTAATTNTTTNTANRRGMGTAETDESSALARSDRILKTLRSRPARTNVLVSEAPLLSYGTSSAARPQSLPARLLALAGGSGGVGGPRVTVKDPRAGTAAAGSSSSSTEKRPFHVYLSELEAALIAELVDKVPENGGYIYYHPAHAPALHQQQQQIRQQQQQQQLRLTGHVDPLAVLRNDVMAAADAPIASFDPFAPFSPYWEVPPATADLSGRTRVSQRDRLDFGGDNTSPSQSLRGNNQGGFGGNANNGAGNAPIAKAPPCGDLPFLFGELGYDVLWGPSGSTPPIPAAAIMGGGPSAGSPTAGSRGVGNAPIGIFAANNTILQKQQQQFSANMSSAIANLTAIGSSSFAYQQQQPQLCGGPSGGLPNIRLASLAVDETTHRFGLRRPSPTRLRVMHPPEPFGGFGGGGGHAGASEDPHAQLLAAVSASPSPSSQSPSPSRGPTDVLHGAVGAIGAAAAMLKAHRNGNANANAAASSVAAASHNTNPIMAGGGGNMLLAPIGVGGGSGASPNAQPLSAGLMAALPNRRGGGGRKGHGGKSVGGHTPNGDQSLSPPPLGAVSSGAFSPAGAFGASASAAFTPTNAFAPSDAASSAPTTVPLSINGGLSGGASVRYATLAAANRLPSASQDAFSSLPAAAGRIRASLRRIIDERFGVGGGGIGRSGGGGGGGDTARRNLSSSTLAGGGTTHRSADGSDGFSAAAGASGTTANGGDDDYDNDYDAGGGVGGYGSAHSLSLSPAAAAAAAASASSSTAGQHCFRYHRVPLKYGHMAELATVLGDLYELLVANADEPKTAFVFGFSDPHKSLLATTAATIVYDIDLRRSYHRAEMLQRQGNGGGGGGAADEEGGVNSGKTTGRGGRNNNNGKKGGASSPHAAGSPSSTTRSNRSTSSQHNATNGQQQQQQAPLPQRPQSTKPSSLEMFPFLARVADENIGIEIGRAAQTLDEILIDCKAYDAVIGDAARSVMYSVLAHLPSEESLAPVGGGVGGIGGGGRSTAAANGGVAVGGHATVGIGALAADGAGLMGLIGSVEAELGDGASALATPLSPRSRRAAAKALREAEAEAAEEQRRRDMVMSLPQLRYCRRVLLGWLEALTPSGWGELDGGGYGFVKQPTASPSRPTMVGSSGVLMGGLGSYVDEEEDDRSAIPMTVTNGGVPRGEEAIGSALTTTVIVGGDAASRAAAEAAAEERRQQELDPLSPRPVVVPDPAKVPITPAATSPQSAAATPFGPIIPLEEAARRFEQYVTLVLFASFVRLSCDARRVNAATGRPLPRFEDHVFPQPAVGSLLAAPSSSSGASNATAGSASGVRDKSTGALSVSAVSSALPPAGIGASVTLNHQLVESLRLGVDMWEGPLRLIGEALDNPDVAPSSGLFASPRGGGRRGFGTGRATGRRNNNRSAADAASAAAEAQRAMEKISGGNACVEDDPSLKRTNRPLHQEDLIDLSVMAGGHLLVGPNANVSISGAAGGGPAASVRGRSRSQSPAAGAAAAASGGNATKATNLANLLASAANTNASTSGSNTATRTAAAAAAAAATAQQQTAGDNGDGARRYASTVSGLLRANTQNPLSTGRRSGADGPLTGGGGDEEGSDGGDGGEEPWEEVVHPLSTAAAALARPLTIFDLEYEGTRLWKRVQYAMHVLR